MHVCLLLSSAVDVRNRRYKRAGLQSSCCDCWRILAFQRESGKTFFCILPAKRCLCSDFYPLFSPLSIQRWWNGSGQWCPVSPRKSWHVCCSSPLAPLSFPLEGSTLFAPPFRSLLPPHTALCPLHILGKQMLIKRTNFSIDIVLLKHLCGTQT